MESKDYDLVSIFDNLLSAICVEWLWKEFWAGRAVTNLGVLYSIVYLFFY